MVNESSAGGIPATPAANESEANVGLPVHDRRPDCVRRRRSIIISEEDEEEGEDAEGLITKVVVNGGKKEYLGLELLNELLNCRNKEQVLKELTVYFYYTRKADTSV